MTYDLQILPTPNEGWATGINEGGFVAGITQVTAPPQPGKHAQATIWPISSSASVKTWRSPTQFIRINDAGDAAGQGWLVTGDDVFDLRRVVPDIVDAFDLNSRFVVGTVKAGGADPPTALGFTYEWLARILTWISPLPGYKSTWALGINSRNDVVGGMDDHALIYSAGKVRDLGIGWLRDINDDGFAVGTIPGSLPNSEIPAWANCEDPKATLQPIPLAPGYTTGQALAINATGTVVGYMGQAWPDLGIAFVYDLKKPHEVAHDLNRRIQLDSGWTLWDACDINDKGQIVGTAFAPYGSPGSRITAYVLTPHNPSFIPKAGVSPIYEWLGGQNPSPGEVETWGKLPAYMRDVFIGLAIANLTDLMGDPSAGREIRKAALAAASNALAELQRRDAAARHPDSSLVNSPLRQRFFHPFERPRDLAVNAHRDERRQ
jgi:hypothetical protein